MRIRLRGAERNLTSLRIVRYLLTFDDGSSDEAAPSEVESCEPAPSFDCVVCERRVPPFHDYMLHNDLWRDAGLSVGFAHIQCVAERLGRRITVEDLSDAPMNEVARYLAGKK